MTPCTTPWVLLPGGRNRERRGSVRPALSSPRFPPREGSGGLPDARGALLHGAARRCGQLFCGTGPPGTAGPPPGAAPRARRAPLGTAPPLAPWDEAAPSSQQPEAAARLHHSPVCTPGHEFSREGQTYPRHFHSKPGTSQRIPPKLPASGARASPQPRGASALSPGASSP